MSAAPGNQLSPKDRPCLKQKKEAAAWATAKKQLHPERDILQILVPVPDKKNGLPGTEQTKTL